METYVILIIVIVIIAVVAVFFMFSGSKEKEPETNTSKTQTPAPAPTMKSLSPDSTNTGNIGVPITNTESINQPLIKNNFGDGGFFSGIWTKIKSLFGINSFSTPSQAPYLGYKDLDKRVNVTTNAMYDFVIKALAESKSNIDKLNMTLIQVEMDKAKSEGRAPNKIDLSSVNYDPTIIQKIYTEAVQNLINEGNKETLFPDKERFVSDNLVQALTSETLTIFKNAYGPGLETEMAKMTKILNDNIPTFEKSIKGDATSGVYDITSAQSFIDTQLMDFHLSGGLTDNATTDYRPIEDYHPPDILNATTEGGTNLIKQLSNIEVKNAFDASTIPDEIKPKGLDNKLINLEMANLANNMENPSTKPFVTTRKYMDPRGLSDGLIDMISQNYVGKDPNSLQMPLKGTGIDYINSGLGFGNEEKIDGIINNYARQHVTDEEGIIYDWDNILGMTANKSVIPNVSGRGVDNMDAIISDVTLGRNPNVF